jgi:1,4-alpha-glucan branching enzyme
MGWMNDILTYAGKDPLYRKWEHRHLTFSLLYAFNENFVLPFSHDEVVHGKLAMLEKVPGDEWQKAATLRALYAYQYTHPGKKLLFMGNEFGQPREWTEELSLDWHLAGQPLHEGLRRFVAGLNALYRQQPALYQIDFEPGGFEWIDFHDHESSVIAFMRHGTAVNETLVVAFNWTPLVREHYRIGVPEAGAYEVLLNSDVAAFGGSGAGSQGTVEAEEVAMHGRSHSLDVALPPLGTLILKKR